MCLSKKERYKTKESIAKNGYDISKVCKFIEQLYGDVDE